MKDVFKTRINSKGFGFDKDELSNVGKTLKVNIPLKKGVEMPKIFSKRNKR